MSLIDRNIQGAPNQYWILSEKHWEALEGFKLDRKDPSYFCEELKIDINSLLHLPLRVGV